MDWQALVHSEATCGEACWSAREDICRCACGGKNHGILRNGERPERTRKLNGYLYQLVAVESPGASCIAESTRPLYNQQREIVKAAKDAGLWKSYWESDPGYPAKLKTASQSEVERWPELAAFRNTPCHLNAPWIRPLTLWVRVDMVEVKNG